VAATRLRLSLVLTTLVVMAPQALHLEPVSLQPSAELLRLLEPQLPSMRRAEPLPGLLKAGSRSSWSHSGRLEPPVRPPRGGRQRQNKNPTDRDQLCEKR
jgi:hypothetical protein